MAVRDTAERDGGGGQRNSDRRGHMRCWPVRRPCSTGNSSMTRRRRHIVSRRRRRRLRRKLSAISQIGSRRRGLSWLPRPQVSRHERRICIGCLTGTRITWGGIDGHHPFASPPTAVAVTWKRTRLRTEGPRRGAPGDLPSLARCGQQRVLATGTARCFQVVAEKSRTTLTSSIPDRQRLTVDSSVKCSCFLTAAQRRRLPPS